MTRVLLATSNGTGMGHLTRQAAIALALGADSQTTLFSLSIGLPLAMELGLTGEYCPSYDRPWIASNAWNSYLRDRLGAIIEETRSEVVVFDGVAAYPGIGKTSSALRDVAFIWLRRGMWQRGSSTKQLRRSGFFDQVVEPGDLASDADRGPTATAEGVVRVAPISLVEVLPPSDRAEARRVLGLPRDREIALVTLGSGRLGEITGPGQMAIRELLEGSDLHVAVTRSAVAANEIALEHGDRVSVISGVYPLVPYLSAFDLAVSSAGYNAAHELVPSGVPTLFVANTSTRTDDQEARASRLAELGLALSARDDDLPGIGTETKRLLDPGLRAELAASAQGTRPSFTGASDAARYVTSFARSFTGRRPTLSVALGEGVQSAKDKVKDLLGEERTNSLKRLLGRGPTPITHRATVRITDDAPATVDEPLPLLVTESLDRDLLSGRYPVEHLLPGSSPEYRQRRLDLVRMYYDIVD
jgi:hypothetical protein